jgi:hypothetical protein
MIQDQCEEIQRLQNVLREIVAMVEPPGVSKNTIGDYAKAALHASTRASSAGPQTGLKRV